MSASNSTSDPVDLELSFSPSPGTTKHYDNPFYDSKKVSLSETTCPSAHPVYRAITHTPVAGCIVSGIYLHKYYMYGFDDALQKRCVVTAYFWVEDVDLKTPLLVLVECEGTSNYHYFSSYDHTWTATPLVTKDNLLASLDINNCNRNWAHTIDISVRDGDACHACCGTKLVTAIVTTPYDKSYYRTTYHISEGEEYRIARFKEGATEIPDIKSSKEQAWVRTFSYSKKPEIPLLLYILGKPKVGRKWYMRAACNLNSWKDITNWTEDRLPHIYYVDDNKEIFLKLLAEAYAPSVVFDSSKGPTTKDYCSYVDSFSGETIEVSKTTYGSKYVKLTHSVKNEETFKVNSIIHDQVKTDGVSTTDEVLNLTIFYWVLDTEYQSPLLVEVLKFDRYEYYTSDKNGRWIRKNHDETTKLPESVLKGALDYQNCIRNGAHRPNVVRKEATTAITCPCHHQMKVDEKKLPDIDTYYWNVSGLDSIAGLLENNYEQTGITTVKGLKKTLIYFGPANTEKKPLLLYLSTSTDPKDDTTAVTWCKRDSVDSTNWSLYKDLPANPESCPDRMRDMLKNFPDTTKTL